jgi:hypothetical protein
MIDNFEQIKNLLKFDTEDDFYFVQILKRKKEHPELGSNSYTVKTYYIKSIEELEQDKGEMICLANYHNARVYINLNRRSFERIAFHTLQDVTNNIMNKDYANVRRSYNSTCGAFANEKDGKKWIVDIDEIGRKANEVLKFIDKLQPIGNKLVAIIETKNGAHLITNPFNVQEFRKEYPDIEIHKNNPTILYIP